MKTLKVEDLEYDVTESEYVDIPSIVHLKSGEVIETAIDGYTHDEEPFCNYIEIGDREIAFSEIEKIELLD